MKIMKYISTDKAPAAIGPYSQAIVTGNLLFASGQIAIIPATGEVLHGTIEEQTELVCQNIGEILRAMISLHSTECMVSSLLKSPQEAALPLRIFRRESFAR